MKKILVSPLDWGLGHASRLVPIVRQLIADGHQVVIAADRLPLAFLRQEFPQLAWVRMPSYQISYAREGKHFAWKIGLQAPKVMAKIYQEHRLLRRIVRQHQIDVVISDNRFGLFHRGIQTVFMTHQIAIQVPNDNAFLEKLLFRLNVWFIRKFDAVWVPDYPGGKLSGKLTQKFRLPVPVTYLGNLSRFYNTLPQTDPTLRAEVLAVLSGPEPQRSMLEEKILEQMQASGRQCILVQGLPADRQTDEQLSDTVRRINFLGAQPLASAYAQAGLVLCRAGYSSIMDLVALGKSACLIPTPGQTEQEYLGPYLQSKGWFDNQWQHEFDLNKAIEAAPHYRLGTEFERIDRLPIAF